MDTYMELRENVAPLFWLYFYKDIVLWRPALGAKFAQNCCQAHPGAEC